MLTEEGLGVQQDYVQAYMWLDLADVGFPASSKEDRDAVVTLRDRVSARMTHDQRVDAQRLVREWLAAHPKPNQ